MSSLRPKKSYRWHGFDPSRGYRQKRPPLEKYVLVRLPPRTEDGLPSGMAVGYRKNGAGAADSPYFVVPGIGGVPTHWCDCLPVDFEWEVS